MTEIKKEIKSYIEGLSNIVYIAKSSYEIWWILVGPDRPKYVNTLNEYLSFFSPCIDAHFQTMIVSLYKLNDRSKGTLSLIPLFRLVKQNNTFSHEDFSEIEKIYNRAVTIWEKVKIIRHNFVAHRSLGQDISKIYEIAKIKPDEFKELIDLTTKILNTINSLYYRTQIAYNMLSAKDHTYQVLDKLSEDLRKAFGEN